MMRERFGRKLFILKHMAINAMWGLSSRLAIWLGGKVRKHQYVVSATKHAERCDKVLEKYLSFAGLGDVRSYLRGQRVMEIGPGRSLYVGLKALAWGAAQYVAVDRLVKTTLHAQRDVARTFQVMLVVFGIGFPIGLVQRMYHAYQERYLLSCWNTMGRLLSLAGILVCIKLQLSLAALVGVLMAIPYCLTFAGGVCIMRRRRWLAPSPMRPP